MALHLENDDREGFLADFLQLGNDSSLEEDLGKAALELGVDEAGLDQHLLCRFFVVFDSRRFERCYDGVSRGGRKWISVSFQATLAEGAKMEYLEVDESGS